MSKKRLRDSKELLSQPRCDEAGLSADTAADDKYSRQSVDTFSSSLDDVISLRSAFIVIVLQIMPSDVHMSAQAAGAGVRGHVPAGEVLRGVPRAALRRPRRRGVRRLDPALQQ